jgi:hypothetical protein
VLQQVNPDNLFQEQVSLTLKKGDNVASKEFVVPAGKSLQIKYATGTATFETFPPALNQAQFEVSIRVIQPNNSVYTFPLTKQLQWTSIDDNVATGGYQVGGNQVGVFGDSGGTIQVVLKRVDIWGSHLADFKLELAISGEYSDF